MKRPENDQWLDEALNETIGSKETRTDFDQWKQQHPQAVNMLTSRAGRKPSALHRPLMTRRIIMKSPITKLAAAAVIGIAILVSIPFFSNSSSVILADVLTRIEQTRAFTYKMKVGTATKQNITVTVSDEFGIKWETETADPDTGKKTTEYMYVLPRQKIVIGLMPSTKQYMRMKLDNDWVQRMKKKNGDPKETIAQIMRCDYTKLGESVIDGVKVEGFRTTDPNYFGGAVEKHSYTLWVGVKNGLPFRSETTIDSDGQMRIVETTCDYQWNIPVQASEFTPVIPKDFTAVEANGLKMPGMNEEAAIEGLRLFAELSGRYPTTLDLRSLSKEITGLSQNSKYMEYLRKELDKLKEEMSRTGEPTKEEFRSVAIQKSMEMMKPLQSPGWFYYTLAKDEKDPVYYGQTVGPNNADAVLLRWKVSDNEYRVIFGDLSVKNITTEALAELEK